MKGVEILRDAQDLARRVAERFVRAAIVAVKNRKRFTVALAGGSTPRAAYQMLATPNPQARSTGSRCTSGGETSGACRPMTHRATIEWRRSRCSMRFPYPRTKSTGFGERTRRWMPQPPTRIPLRESFGLSDGLDLILLGLGRTGTPHRYSRGSPPYTRRSAGSWRSRSRPLGRGALLSRLPSSPGVERSSSSFQGPLRLLV